MPPLCNKKKEEESQALLPYSIVVRPTLSLRGANMAIGDAIKERNAARAFVGLPLIPPVVLFSAGGEEEVAPEQEEDDHAADSSSFGIGNSGPHQRPHDPDPEL